MTKSSFEVTSTRVEQYLSGRDKAATAKEIAEFLEVANSTAYGILQLMEVFGTVQKLKRGRSQYYVLKDVYDEEHISAMLPPERVARIPRRKYAPRGTGHSKLPVHERLLEEHLSTMRVQASSGKGPSALAIIGLFQTEEMGPPEETREPQRVLDVLPEAEGLKQEEPEMIRCEPHGKVESIPGDFRLLTQRQTRHLKEHHLRELEGYEEIERFGNFFADRSSLEDRRYGNIFYASMSTNPGVKAYRVTVDDSLSLELEAPAKRLRKAYRSKYDPIIDRFIESGHRLVEITVEEKSAYNVKCALDRRIETRGLSGKVEASVVDEWVYLEKAH